MSDQQSRYKVTITWASDNAKVEKEISAWGLSEAGESAVCAAWCAENGKRGEDEAIVEVSTVGGTISHFYDVSTEPDLSTTSRRIDLLKAAETLARWAELDAEFKAKMAAREAAKSPREKLFDLVRKAKTRALTAEECAHFTQTLLFPPLGDVPPDERNALVDLLASLLELGVARDRCDRLIAQLQLDDQSTSSPVSASTT